MVCEGTFARRAPGIQTNVPAIYPNALPPNINPSSSPGYLTSAFSGVPHTGTKNGERGGQVEENRGKVCPARAQRANVLSVSPVFSNVSFQLPGSEKICFCGGINIQHGGRREDPNLTFPLVPAAPPPPPVPPAGRGAVTVNFDSRKELGHNPLPPSPVWVDHLGGVCANAFSAGRHFLRVR